jgi:tRNA G18 (ribose-2'-O)-methylase SpoU
MTTTAAAARLRVQIPMPGAADSLNVAATAVVCLFECLGGREAAGGKRGATMAKYRQ